MFLVEQRQVNQFPCSHVLPKMGCLVNKPLPFAFGLPSITNCQVGLYEFSPVPALKILYSEFESAWRRHIKGVL